MSVVMLDYHGHRTDLPDAVEAGRWFDEQAESILPHGGSGQVIWFGPADGLPQLRVDIDVDVDRAALRWLPDGAHAIELSPDRAITIVESPDGGLVTIPADLARVHVATARRAVIEYVTENRRPQCLRWNHD